MDRPTTHPVRNRALSRTELATMAIAALLLLWLIVTRTLAAHLAIMRPEAALFVQPNEPRALLLRAETALNTLLATAEPPAAGEAEPVGAIDGEGVVQDRLTDIARLAKQALTQAFESNETSAPAAAVQKKLAQSELDHVRDLAIRVLKIRPVDADAMSLLARIADVNGQRDATAKLMEATLRMSVRESYAAYWLLQDEIERGDAADALKYADILLRTRSTSMPYVAPKLAMMAQSNDHRPLLVELLAKNPPWRNTFFARFMNLITDARTPLLLYLDLKDTAAAPTQAELALYLNFLANNKFHELSYYTWLQFKSPDELARVTPLYNGGFESSPEGGPFDWKIAVRSGVRSTISAHPAKDGQQALTIDFRANRASDPAVRQTLLLPSGSHELTGQFASSLLGPRGLVWRVQCLNGKVLANSEILRGSAQGWKSFSARFDIPSQGCRVQELKLAMDDQQGSDRFVSGTIWFDDLAIVRRNAAQPQQP
jgi:hypothetical protein